MEEKELLAVISNGPEKTFEEIGAELGVSWQRAQQIYNNALRKIRMNMSEEAQEELHSYLATEECQWEQIELKALEISDSDNLRGFWKEENNS